MGNIGPARQRYEVLALPAFVLDESDRVLLEHAGVERVDAAPPDASTDTHASTLSSR